MKLSIFTVILFLGITFNSAAEKKSSLGNPFKTMMDGLSNRAKDLLDKATNNGLILETNASEQVLNIIANTQQAYQKELKATSYVINSKEQQIISGITSVLDQIQNHTIENVSSKMTQLALMIPYVGNHPQLTTWTGNVITPNAENIKISFKGVFKYSSNSNYEPLVKLGNDVYRPSEKTESYLSYDIPKTKLIFSQKKVNYSTIILDIPYKDGYWRTKNNAQYKIKLILLPIYSGKFELFISTYVDEISNKQKSCDLSWAGHEDLTKYCYPDPGYVIDISTIKRVLTGERGDGFGNDHFDLGSDFTKPEVNIGYRIKSDGDESFVSYNITYSMSKTIQVPIDKSLGEETFKWGDSKTYTITDDKATWKAVYTRFDNRKNAFTTSSENNPYVRIKQVANQITVSFAPFD